MWHEARRQERKIRGMMVDYKKRSERRRLYYHRIKADPTQFLRLQGVPCKIYIEEDATEIEAAASDLMPWQGDRSNMIDRFDVRANLDIIPEPCSILISSESGENAVIDQKCQYERWRTLATNDLVGLGEDECLAQISEDEKAVLPSKKETKSSSAGGAQIGFTYDSSNVDSDSDSDIEESEANQDFLATDPDLDITFDVRELEAEQKIRLNEIAAEAYAIPDFTRLHIEDKVESEMREFELREEQSRAERVAKLSKTERRKEKEERRKTREIPPHMRVDDPYRKPQSRRSSSRRREESDSSSDEEKTFQNIEISSARSNTYKNVKHLQSPPKTSLPTFLKPKTANAGLTSLAAARKQLLSSNVETFDFGTNDVAQVPENLKEVQPESRSCSRSHDRSCSKRSRSRRSYSRSSSRGRSRSRGRFYSRGRSHSSSRSRSRSTGRSSSMSRHRRYTSTSGKTRSRSRTRGDRGLSPRRRSSPVRTIKAKSPESSPKTNNLPLKKADSLKALKPHERLKLKLQSQLKKRQRDEKKKEQAQAEAREQEAYERAEELRILKRQMWEKEEEEYWKKREEEEREYQKKKAEEKATRQEDCSSNGDKQDSRSRSGSRRRHNDKTRSKSKEKSDEKQDEKQYDKRDSKRSKSTSSPSSHSKRSIDVSSKERSKISLVPEYEGVDAEEESSRNSGKRRENTRDRRSADRSKRVDNDRYRSDDGGRKRYEGYRRRTEPNESKRIDDDRRYPDDMRHRDYERSRHQNDRARYSDDSRRRDDDRSRRPDDRTRYHDERQRGRDTYRVGYR